MKKTLAIILSIVMLLGCLGATSASAASQQAEIKLNGSTFSAPVKSTVTYTVVLKTPELIENGQFTIVYPDKLLAVSKVELPNLNSYMLNYKDNLVNEIKFNFSNYMGFDFTQAKTLISVEFDVIGAGAGELSLNKHIVCNLKDDKIIDKCTFTESLAVPGAGSDGGSTKAPELSAKTKSLKAGKTFTLKVNNTSDAVTFTSNKKSVATVNNKGVVTALKKGKATITATTKSGVKLNCTVSVTSNPKLSKQQIRIKVNQTKKIKITGKAKAVNNKYSKSKIAKVKSKASATTLKIKGLKKGKATLKIKVNNKILKLKVTVIK